VLCGLAGAKVAKFRLYLRENLNAIDFFNVESDEEFLGFE